MTVLYATLCYDTVEVFGLVMSEQLEYQSIGGPLISRTEAQGR